MNPNIASVQTNPQYGNSEKGAVGADATCVVPAQPCAATGDAEERREPRYPFDLEESPRYSFDIILAFSDIPDHG